MSFDRCLSLLSLQDKLPVGEIRETAKEYAAEGVDATEAMAKAVSEHLQEAQRQEAHIIATVRNRYVAGGGKLPEAKVEAPKPEADTQHAPIHLVRMSNAKDFDWNRDKPNGTYASLADDPATFKSPFESDYPDGQRHDFTYTPKNPLVVDDLTARHARFKGTLRGEGETSAGIKALHAYLPKAEFDHALTMSKAQVQEEIAQRFPDVDTSRAHDAYEALEIWGAQEAKARGHDVIVARDSEVPALSEAVLLNGTKQGDGVRYSVSGDQTETPAFKRWFGKSKVVSKDGSPLKVYHGTRADINEFKPGSSPENAGIFFTNSPFIAGAVYANGEGGISMDRVRAKLDEMGFDKAAPSNADFDAAWKFADKLRAKTRVFDWMPEDDGTSLASQILAHVEHKAQDGNDAAARALGDVLGVSVDANAPGANVVPAYLSMQNPLEINGAGLSFDHGEQADWIKQARAEGRDGVIIRNYDDGGFGGVENYTSAGRHNVYIAFKPEQVKSAIGNSGAFDPASPDIRYSADHPLAAESAREISPLVQSLADKGAIVLHQDASTLPVKGKAPAGVQALTTADGTIHVVANALGDNARGVILHEAFHAGGEALVGSKAWSGLTDCLGKLYSMAEKSSGTARAFFDAARSRVETAKAKGAVAVGMEHEEFGAYAIEEYAKAPLTVRKWVDDLIGAVKAWALRRFGKQLGDVTPAQLSSLAKLALLDKATSTARSANPDLVPAFSASGTAPPAPVSEEHRSALSKMIGVPKELLKSAAFNVRMAVVPMAAGAEQAMAMAKDFANHNRRAATQWAAFDKVLKNSYSDEQLKKMWVAADQENDLRREGRTSATEGLASLTAGEHRTVELLHAYGEQLWTKAKEAGLVGADSEGVHYWTPRMAANIVADGSAEMIRQPAGEFSKEARNLRTSASSTKQRKHETTAESEAALKAKLGEDAEYVKNIRVMPMAMAQLEKAIAGRTLVNQIRAHGKLAGDDLVSDEGRPNFVTFDHPALKQWRPKMDWQAADPALIASRGYDVRADGVYRDGEKLASYRVQDGEVQKLAPLEDSNGKPVMESFPLFVRKDFAGPLKAVFATDQGAIYNGLMSLKGGVTSMIMISPLTHNLVIWGKAMPTMMATMGWKNNLKNAGTLGLHGYFIGNRARADHALMQELTEAGLVPVSGRGMNQDVAAIHNGIQPGRSLTAKALGSVADLASKRAGEAVRKGVDAAGHFWHETLLWDRVADLQAGMAVMMRTSLMDKGLSQDTANRIAAHFANRYAGMIPREAMSEVANKIANLSLFSKSFTMTNLGAYKDLIGGLPKDVQAQIKMRTIEIQKALGAGEVAAEQSARAKLRKVQSVTRKKAASVLVLDVAAMAAITSLAQALWEGQDGKQIAEDFRERMGNLGVKMKEDPLAVLGHPLDAISSLSQTADNPHGKEDRVRVGEDEEGNSYYARLPVGKVGEELKQYGNLSTGMHLLRNKMSTFLRPIADLTANEDFTGKRIINPHDNIVKQVAAFGAYWIKSQLPVEDAVALGHVVKGDADHMDKLKLMGTATGLSVGRLSGGDAVAELRYTNREQAANLRDVLPDAREALRRGDQEKAQQLLEDAGQTPREAMRTLRQIEQPDHISKQSMRKFNQHADEGERARLEKMRVRAQ